MRRRLGLRSRLAAWFAVIASALSLLLGVVTYVAVRSVLLSEVEAAALDQTIADARVVAAADAASESQILAALRPPVRSRPFLLRDGEWFSASIQLRNDDLPPELVTTVLSGTPARQRFAALGSSLLAVGLPIQEGISAYFEVFSLQSVATTLGTLRFTLSTAGLGATVAAAALGAWGGRRVLRPVREVERIAEEIAGGSLSARLDESLDPDLERLSAAFNRMADSVSDRIDREARFASDVSHELRSPLTTVMASVSVLERRRDELSPEGREALDLLHSDVVRLHEMVDDLLELARHDAGRETVELEEHGLAEIVTVTVERVKPNLDVVVAPSALGVTVAVDPRRLERIIANYVQNADTHGRGATRVTVSSVGNRAVVAVEDEGPGVADGDRAAVFGRFARGSSTSRRRANQEGSGLGLALAAENAALMGGTVRLEAGPRAGTRAVLEVPVVVG